MTSGQVIPKYGGYSYSMNRGIVFTVQACMHSNCDNFQQILLCRFTRSSASFICANGYAFYALPLLALPSFALTEIHAYFYMRFPYLRFLLLRPSLDCAPLSNCVKRSRSIARRLSTITCESRRRSFISRDN